MMISLTDLEGRMAELNEIIDLKQAELESAPPGKLILSSRGGQPQFYYKQEGEKKRKYLGKNSTETVKALAQKYYDQKVLDVSKRERGCLNNIIARYRNGLAEDVYAKLDPIRRELVTPIIKSDEEFVREWLSQDYHKMGFEDGAPEYYTDKGLRVRSKSEIGILNKYDKAGIPFLYEKSLFLNGWGWVCPDVTLLNVRLRKEYIHEHLGRMDDPVYLESNIAKVNAYMKNGYLPGENLLLTFETKKHPFDTRIIDEFIRQYLT